MAGQRGFAGQPGPDAVRAEALKQVPTPPKYLDAEAKKAWKATAKEMIR